MLRISRLMMGLPPTTLRGDVSGIAGISIFTGHRAITAIPEAMIAVMVEPIAAMMSYGLSEVGVV